MPRVLVTYVRWVERFNWLFGRIAMYALLALMGVMLYGALARAVGNPPIWTDEMAQFLLMGYFMIGGAYALQLGSAVRMDLLYSRWSDKTRALVDILTVGSLLFYLCVLLWGGWESLQYALEYGERRRGTWRPYMAPVKAIMVLGILMMILQVLAFTIRDIARLKGEEI
ncbi:TRAP transporter small permease subunit [Pararhodobacter aggregans]|uniref:TRAP transporter small permease protein n=1 Tax=Pararhodobacter aggregans TaxID=404875 RepID=A0A2T7UNH9_9RHOB|nr:TRAP transporter small permease subunit [Pararhodobacter aggregans]PTX00728.1 TRAP-type mannitol/chloroaromatic compound transport system permease small subunit [Pararhodobacter aggregans]PVE46263.1 C4-dicarboxylate ABC transporter [Pararhodobacter aggregans]